MAPSRSGKSSQLIISWVADWSKPAVVTSVRPDVALNTYQIRKELGPVPVLDLSDTAWPDRLAWPPTMGCGAFDIACDRADLMVTIGKTTDSDSTNAGFFGTSATQLLAGWLHAAAITRRTTDDILTWALDESNLEPISLLGDHPRAQPGVAALLEGIYRARSDTRSPCRSWAPGSIAGHRPPGTGRRIRFQSPRIPILLPRPGPRRRRPPRDQRLRTRPGRRRPGPSTRPRRRDCIAPVLVVFHPSSLQMQNGEGCR